ncbi:VUT family protein [Helicobacter cholecystus]|uniref:Probable queuosine precursor transporter n=1 Tax=Helicobacter cholecystus TaxID=45498 RepID=A0A3D8IV03_9HELI|nr:queuosine precursor transporter [Helicobacter cholecystus]RDU69062.1 VUT family protein [Helicobacter cholecystus]VEJ24594.1 conserved hypothetical integral membrane protein [Helicobacter cholecystus]
MSNEFLLCLSVVLIYGGIVIAYIFFKVRGLLLFMLLATVLANIEVTLLIKAFGLEQTLGNILFASTFLITDALSEIRGKELAQQSIRLTIFGSIIFLISSQMWLLYTLQDSLMHTYLSHIFSQTPRIIIVSLIVFAIASYVDVWLYHWWWRLSTKIWGSKKKFLWLRNNASTLFSQLLNTVFFSFGAFYGVLEINVITKIILSSYMIFICTSLLDTPVLYLLVYLSKRNKQRLG